MASSIFNFNNCRIYNYFGLYFDGPNSWWCSNLCCLFFKLYYMHINLSLYSLCSRIYRQCISLCCLHRYKCWYLHSYRYTLSFRNNGRIMRNWILSNCCNNHNHMYFKYCYKLFIWSCRFSFNLFNLCCRLWPSCYWYLLCLPYWMSKRYISRFCYFPIL